MDRITKSDATEPGKHTPVQPVKREGAAAGRGPRPVDMKIGQNPTPTTRRTTDHATGGTR